MDAVVVTLRVLALPVAVLLLAIHQLSHGWLFRGHSTLFDEEPLVIQCRCGKVIWRVLP